MPVRHGPDTTFLVCTAARDCFTACAARARWIGMVLSSGLAIVICHKAVSKQMRMTAQGCN